jgi:hypothetical protein
MKRSLKKRTLIIIVTVAVLISLIATVCAIEVKDSLFYMNTPTFINTKTSENTSGFNIAVKGELKTKEDYEAYIFTLEENGALSLSFNHQSIQESMLDGWRVTLYYIENPDDDWYEYNELTYFDAFWADVTSTWGETGVEAGTYCVVVEPGQLFLAGDFDLTVSFTPTESFEKEFNDTKETATDLRLNRVIYGSSSQRQADADLDYYKFEITNDGYIDMVFSHDNSQLPQVGWVVKLFTENDYEIASFASKYQDPELRTGKINLHPGVYYILVETQVQDGMTYRLKVETGLSETTEFEINDTPEQAEIFKENSIVSGMLAPKVMGLDKDYFKITLTEKSYLTVNFVHEFDEKEFDEDYNGWNVRLLRPEKDGTYTEIVKRVSKWNDEGVNITGMGLPAGDYYILIDADSMRYTSVPYSLTYTCQTDLLFESESNNTKETANEVGTLKDYYGTLISTDMNFDRDYYKFEVDKDRNIAFHFYHDYTNENDLAWVATIIDENGKEISKLESAKNEYQVTTGVIELKKGTYYILIENDLYSSEDTYWFRIVE